MLDQGAQGRGCVELAARIQGEDAGAHLPGPKQARPGRLCPAGIGDAPMDILWFEIQPKFACDSMSEAITRLRVQNHFGWTRGSARKINDPWVIALGRLRIEAGIALAQT